MSRKLFVKILAGVCIAQGFWYLGEFLYPIFFLSSPFPIKLNPLVGGVLGTYAGFSLFRLREAGRKLILVLSYLFVLIITSIIFWTIFFWSEGYASAIYYFDKAVFTSENRFVSAGIDFVLLIIRLLIIFFLSHEKTKALFVSEVVNNADSDRIVELI